jgi:hypothetical protein
MHKDQLIEALSKIPGNPKIILSSDAEGNSYEELDGFSTEYVNSLFSEQEISIFSEDDIRDDNDGELPGNFDPVVVLWPF